jgi:hypothetical protein
MLTFVEKFNQIFGENVNVNVTYFERFVMDTPQRLVNVGERFFMRVIGPFSSLRQAALASHTDIIRGEYFTEKGTSQKPEIF